MNIIAIEGIRGTGKTTLINEFKKKYDSLMYYKFPTEDTVNKLSKRKYDMEVEDDVIDYNLQFIMDFIHFYRYVGVKSQYKNKPILVDRYVLSNLAHFKYDMYKLKKGGAETWNGISKMLYIMYNDFFVEKPELIIYLKTNKYMQPDTKFDDGLYKGAEHELEWFYDTELSNLYNILDIPFYSIEALKPETFDNAEQILKKYGYLK